MNTLTLEERAQKLMERKLGYAISPDNEVFKTMAEFAKDEFEAGRSAGLEEAAKIAEGNDWKDAITAVHGALKNITISGNFIAAAIRNLKG